MPMRCPRCDGFMITAQLKELSSSAIAHGWRCLICGKHIDPVIEGNRIGHGVPVHSRARVPGTPVKSTKRALQGKGAGSRYW